MLVGTVYAGVGGVGGGERSVCVETSVRQFGQYLPSSAIYIYIVPLGGLLVIFSM